MSQFTSSRVRTSMATTSFEGEHRFSMFARMVLRVDLHEDGNRTTHFAANFPPPLLQNAVGAPTTARPLPLCLSACLFVCLLEGRLTVSSVKRSQNRQTLSLSWSMTRLLKQHLGTIPPSTCVHLYSSLRNTLLLAIPTAFDLTATACDSPDEHWAAVCHSFILSDAAWR
ncbi:TPA: hypothetical protein ACH3X1_008963 [Trebouxia sp. C0004]